MSGIAVVTNPRSRRNRRDQGLTGRLAQIVGDSGWVSAPDGLEALESWARDSVDNDPDVVVVCGGDGTLHRVLSAWMRASDGRPPRAVALLRGGTMNTIARSLGVRGGCERVLQQVVDTFHNGSRPLTVRRWLMVIDHRHYGFLFGNGVISNFLELYYQADDPGPSTAVWILFRLIVSALVRGPYIRHATRPFEGRVKVDGELWEKTQWFAVGAGTVDDIGMRFRPFSRCLENPGRMHMVGLANRPLEFLFELVRIRLARPLRSPRNAESVCQEFLLESETPIGYMIDGDFHRAEGSLRVSVGPPVEFIVC